MKLKVAIPAFALILAFVFFCFMPGKKVKAASNNSAGSEFVLVELFTSEGCSSCPPADDLAARLIKEYKNVYLLSYHVDYWNRLGWKDRFSDAAFTARQNKYAGIFHLSSIYTPQAVINGSFEFTGSDKSQLYKTVNEQLKMNPDKEIVANAASSGDKVSIDYKIINAGRNETLNIAIVQKEAHTKVTGGENGGRVLNHVQVVRSFRTISQPGNHGNVILVIPSGLTAKDLQVISFLQNDSFKITAANESDVQ